MRTAGLYSFAAYLFDISYFNTRVCSWLNFFKTTYLNSYVVISTQGAKQRNEVLSRGYLEVCLYVHSEKCYFNWIFGKSTINF